MKRIAILICCIIQIIGCSKNPTTIDPEPIEQVKYIDNEAAWSPDGLEIVYYHAGVDSGGIYIINSDGTNRRPFLINSSADKLWGLPDWSPDGNWLLLNELNSAQIYKIKYPSGDSLTQLTFNGRNFFPSWSPDGKRIAWDTNYMDSLGANVIWLMDFDGNNKTDISQHGVGEWRMPDWSPDGNIIHCRYLTGVLGCEIFKMDSLGQNSIRLTNNHNDDRYPKVSTDCSYITFSSQADGESPRAWRMDIDGTNLLKLTETGGTHPAWSPDGTKIVYCNTVDGCLWIMNADGTGKYQLTP